MRGGYSKDNTDSFIKVATKIMFMQMSANVGIKKFVDKAVESIVK